MTMITVDALIAIHDELIMRTGGGMGLRDRALLESAVMNCYQTFDDEELYPGTVEKASRLAFGICKNHPFIDGNKRIAIVALFTALRLGDIKIYYTQAEAIALGLGIADGSIGYEAIVDWILSHENK